MRQEQPASLARPGDRVTPGAVASALLPLRTDSGDAIVGADVIAIATEGKPTVVAVALSVGVLSRPRAWRRSGLRL